MGRSKPLAFGVVLVAIMFTTGCSNGSAPETDDEVVAATEAASTVPATPAPAAPTTTSAPTTTAPPTTTTTTTTVPPEPVFDAVVHEIDDVIAARMSLSWREGCPVGLEQLRLVEVTHYDYEGGVQVGELVVNEDQVGAMISVFERLYELKFPIEQMRLVDEFEADDMLSMQANNTSAFNCRFVAGTDRWSQHAYGRAIDINPLVNPYVQGSRVSPPEGAQFVDRNQDYPGLVKDGDDVVQAFAEVGWSWGGYWSSSKDYQHFSASGT